MLFVQENEHLYFKILKIDYLQLNDSFIKLPLSLIISDELILKLVFDIISVLQ